MTSTTPVKTPITVWTIAKWIAWLCFFPITVPYLLIRYLFRRKPNLSVTKRVFSSIGIVFAWLIVLTAILPTPPPTDQGATNLQPVATSTNTIVEKDDLDSATAIEATSTKQIQPVTANAATEHEATPSVSEATSTKAALLASSYLVTRVIDGDTIDISMNGKTERVRLIGIDTPETVDPRKPVQCFGKEASAKLTAMLNGQRVTLETDPSQDERDKYDRLLAYVFLADGTNANLALIQQGYANEYTYRVPYKYQTSFKAAALAAKEAKVGLWADDTCAGNTTQPAAPTSPTANQPSSTAPAPTTPNTASNNGGVIKKSTTDICHEPGSTFYERTKNYTPYQTLEECLQSGGRLPKR